MLTVIAVATGCPAQRDALAPAPLPAPSGPSAHPARGGPVMLLGAVQLQRAYGVPAMLAAGISGAGTVTADMVPYLNPRVAGDLAVYSRRYGLPPARLDIVDYGAGGGGPAGPAWDTEGTDDVEMMHAMAPGAALAYVEVPGSSPRSLSLALAWAAGHLRPDVANFSLGTAEWPGAGSPVIRAGFTAAARAGVSVTAGTGDTGPAEPVPGGRFLYPNPVPLWPASDPLVTAVGGTRLRVDAAGYRTRPDIVSEFSAGPASGAGLPAVFPRPSWQDGVRGIVGEHRGGQLLAASCNLNYAGITAGGARMHLRGGELAANYDVRQMLTAAGLVDAAAGLGPDHRDPRQLRPAGINGGGRVDRFYVTSQLWDCGAVGSYTQKDGGGSDHEFAMLTIGLDALAKAQPPQSWR
jgi:hypothetical protein